MVDQERAAAIELEVEVALASLRFDKELYTTVLPHFAAVFCSHTTDVLVLDDEPPEEVVFIVSEPRERTRAMVTTLGQELIHCGRSQTWPGFIRKAGRDSGYRIVHREIKYRKRQGWH